MPTQANVPPTPHPHIASKRLVASEQPHWNLPRRRSAAIELIGAHPSHATPPHATAPLAGCPGQIKRGGDGFGHERSDPSRVEQAGFDVRAPQPPIAAATTTPPELAASATRGPAQITPTPTLQSRARVAFPPTTTPPVLAPLPLAPAPTSPPPTASSALARFARPDLMESYAADLRRPRRHKRVRGLAAAPAVTLSHYYEKHFVAVKWVFPHEVLPICTQGLGKSIFSRGRPNRTDIISARSELWTARISISRRSNYTAARTKKIKNKNPNPNPNHRRHSAALRAPPHQPPLPQSLSHRARTRETAATREAARRHVGRRHATDPAGTPRGSRRSGCPLPRCAHRRRSAAPRRGGREKRKRWRKR